MLASRPLNAEIRARIKEYSYTHDVKTLTIVKPLYIKRPSSGAGGLLEIKTTLITGRLKGVKRDSRLIGLRQHRTEVCFVTFKYFLGEVMQYDVKYAK